MAYLQIDDRMAEHQKIEALTPAQFMGHFRAMCWSARNRSDGHIPPQLLPSLRITKAWVTRYVDVGVWDVNGNGWVVHDFLEFNPPSDPEARKRWFAARRKRRQRDGGSNDDEA
jgi:hypothetical protein